MLWDGTDEPHFWKKMEVSLDMGKAATLPFSHDGASWWQKHRGLPAGRSISAEKLSIKPENIPIRCFGPLSFVLCRVTVDGASKM